MWMNPYSQTSYMNLRLRSSGYFKANSRREQLLVTSRGLCGTFDADPSNEMMLPDGSMTSSRTAWFEAYRVRSVRQA